MFTLESILDIPPFSWSQSEKERFYAQALSDLAQFHSANCPEFAKMRHGFSGSGFSGDTQSESDLFLPVRLFKQYALKSVPESEIVKTMTSSGTTGQTPSRIFLDRATAANQSKVLMKICSDFLGSKRLPMLIIDSKSTIKNRNLFSARGAGILGFSMLGHAPTYALDDDMNLDLPAIEAFLEKYADSDIFVFGFTFMIWEHFYRALAQAGKKLPLERGIMLHGGGWKKLLDQAVDNETFKQKLNDVCGIKKVFNYYGMVEQTGSIFMECECGRLHASIFSDVIIRDGKTFGVCPVGQRGLIQLVSLLPGSYPGYSILSEDEGEITGIDDCPCGRKGKTFKIYGRIKNAEVRGCSDTYTKKTTEALEVNSEQTPSSINLQCLDSVKWLVGSPEMLSNQTKPMRPYSESVCSFLDELSRQLRSDSQARLFPDVQTFSFWCRKGNIAKLKAAFQDDALRLGRGLAFHVSPSNVPINFAFSFVFGLLAGNANIVRVPSKAFPQTQIVAQAINAVFSQGNYNEIARNTALVQYERNDEITAFFSARAQARIIWGGDATIRSIQRFPIDVRGVEIAFSDRYSISLFNAQSVESAPDEQLTRLAQGFYNDTYLMDQNACSSPHVVFWLGKDVSNAQNRFWSALDSIAQKYDLPPVKAVDKLTRLFSNYADFDQIAPVIRHSNALWRANLNAIPQNLADLRGQFGLFYEKPIACFDEILPFITGKFQTLTCFGIDKEQVANCLADNAAAGLDRLVDVGAALDIGVIWDGYDIIKTLSRIIQY